jgi:PilZ domain
LAEQLLLGMGMMRVEGAMAAERSQRAIDIMRSVLEEERGVSRVHVTVPASVTCPSLNCEDRLAIMRDLSTSGAFFYAELDALEGLAVTLQFVLAAFGKNIRMVCQGSIVRVERFPRGAATGIAVEFDHCNMFPADFS